MRSLKWIAAVLAMCLLLTALFASVAEELPQDEMELQAYEAPDDSEDVDGGEAEMDVVSEDTANDGSEAPQELEAPLADPDAIEEAEPGVPSDEAAPEDEIDGGYMVDAPVAALSFARVQEDQVQVYSDPIDFGVIARLAEGETVLITGYGGTRVQVAFNGDGAIYEGFVEASALVELNAEETAAYLDLAATRGAVVLYEDDINQPLAALGDNSSFGLNALMASGNYKDLGNDTRFTINGKEIYANQFPDTGPGNCWAWAQKVYRELWGCSFDSSFEGTAARGLNMLRNLSDDERTLTPEHLKQYVQYAQPGATLRIQSCPSSCSGFQNDGLSCGHNGHSLIIVDKDASGVYTMDSHSSSQHTRHYTWDGFCKSWAKYGYIKYIKWPNAKILPPTESLDGVSVRSYTGQYRARATATEGVSVWSKPTEGTVVATLKYPSTFTAGKRSAEEVDGASWIYGATDAGVNGWVKLDDSIADVNANIAVTGVSLDFNTLSVLSRGTSTLKANVEPLDATKKDVTWTSSDESIATVSAGVVTGVSAGTATITATTADGSKTATCEVTVSKATAQAALVKTGSNGTVKITTDDRLQLSADFATAKKWKLKSVTSSAPKVASVDKTGMVTPKSAGKTTITVLTKNKKKATLTVQVSAAQVETPVTPEATTEPAQDLTTQTQDITVKLNVTGTKKLKKGKTLKLKATVTPADSATSLTWKSSNAKVATVDANGKVKACKKGTCYIGVGIGNTMYAKVKIKVP